MKKQRIQVTKSEQILPNLSIVYDYDEPLTTREEFLTILNNSLNTKCEILIYKINPIDKKTDWYFKNEKYDEELKARDQREDKNEYKFY